MNETTIQTQKANDKKREAKRGNNHIAPYGMIVHGLEMVEKIPCSMTLCDESADICNSANESQKKRMKKRREYGCFIGVVFAISPFNCRLYNVCLVCTEFPFHAFFD